MANNGICLTYDERLSVMGKPYSVTSMQVDGYAIARAYLQ